MQNIIRTNKTTNFTILDNGIINAELSALARMTLIYLLSKPSSWKLRATDIKRHLGIGINKVYRLLQELREAGYIVMTRIQSAVQWLVYDTPQGNVGNATGRAVIDRDGFHHDGSSDDLVRTEKAIRTEKPQQRIPVPEPIPATAAPIVVVPEEVIDQKEVVDVIDDRMVVPHIQSQHQITARQSLRTLTSAEADAVVTAFTLAMSKGCVQNPVGYLLQLVKACKAGSFSPVGAAGAPTVQPLDDRLRLERQRHQEAQERGKMTVEQHARWLAENFGARPVDAGKASNRGGSLKSMLGWV